MFNGKKIDEIMATTLESQNDIRELNRRFAKNNVNKLEDLLTSDKNFQILNDKLLEVLTNQEQIIKNQQQFIPPTKRKRKKALSNASGWHVVSEEEKVTFMEMYDLGESMTDIAVATKRTSSTVSNWIRKLLKARDEETITKSK